MRVHVCEVRCGSAARGRGAWVCHNATRRNRAGGRAVGQDLVDRVTNPLAFPGVRCAAGCRLPAAAVAGDAAPAGLRRAVSGEDTARTGVPDNFGPEDDRGRPVCNAAYAPVEG